MLKRFSKHKWFLCIVIAIVVSLFSGHEKTFSFGKQVLTLGSRGGDVYELQGRLSYLGYFKGKIDGRFGWVTYKSVRTFQWKFGMRVDGIVGPKTKLMLWKATKNWRPSGSTPLYSSSRYSSQDAVLLARAVYGEARGEPYAGQVAVAAVILNRVSSPLFPNTISGVIFQPGAFTCVSDGQIWLTPNGTAYKASRDAINGWDPSGNALYYFNPDTASSSWIWSRPQIKKIGNHIFTK